ncbi:RNA polymerase II-binding domain-containing protein [Usnea florida]
MAYTDDAVKAKLSALNESQESIVTVAQWVMFHRRHADRTATLWLQRLKDSGSNKRLNLVYLANEVAQQSKARRKDDFLIAFSPIIAEATAIAYKGATNEVQQKLRRSVEVWRQRLIFEPTILEAIEARIDGTLQASICHQNTANTSAELDKTRSSNKKPLLGGSLFSSSSGPSAPPEIVPLVPLQIAVSKAAATTLSAVPTADTEYDKLTDPSKPTPTPPVHAARLSALLKNLANAEGAVSESIKARRGLIAGLESIISTNRTALADEEAQRETLATRKNVIEAKKRDVEDGIMRGLSAPSTPVVAHGSPISSDPRTNGRAISPNDNTASVEPERPDVEELTPPPQDPSRTLAASPIPTTPTAPPPTTHIQPTPSPFHHAPIAPPTTAGADLLSSLSMPPVRHYASTPGSAGGGSMAKKRKVDDDYPDFGSGEDAMADLDDDVAELLRAESGGAR